MITLFGNVASGTACLLNMTVKQRCLLSCYFSKESDATWQQVLTSYVATFILK